MNIITLKKIMVIESIPGEEAATSKKFDNILVAIDELNDNIKMSDVTVPVNTIAGPNPRSGKRLCRIK
jgi:hypothetical protein